MKGEKNDIGNEKSDTTGQLQNKLSHHEVHEGHEAASAGSDGTFNLKKKTA